MFQFPRGPHPFPVGVKVRALTRPWWGIGVVVPHGRGGLFTVRWEDYGADGRLVSRGQVEELQLVLSSPASSPTLKPSAT